MARFVALMFLCLLVVLTLTSVDFAQVPTGIPDFGTYDANGIVTINLAYLSAHVHVPIRTSNARNLSIPVYLMTDGSFTMQGTSPNITYAPNGGWRTGSTILSKLNYTFSAQVCN